MIEKRGNSWCVIHAHFQKPGSKTDKPPGTPIKCYSFIVGNETSENNAKEKAKKLHTAILLSQQMRK